VDVGPVIETAAVEGLGGQFRPDPAWRAEGEIRTLARRNRPERFSRPLRSRRFAGTFLVVRQAVRQPSSRVSRVAGVHADARRRHPLPNEAVNSALLENEPAAWAPNEESRFCGDRWFVMIRRGHGSVRKRHCGSRCGQSHLSFTCSPLPDSNRRPLSMKEGRGSRVGWWSGSADRRWVLSGAHLSIASWSGGSGWMGGSLR
jgi:hypothetical protein